MEEIQGMQDYRRKLPGRNEDHHHVRQAFGDHGAQMPAPAQRDPGNEDGRRKARSGRKETERNYEVAQDQVAGQIHSLQRIEFFHEEEEWRGRKTPLLHLLFISQADI